MTLLTFIPSQVGVKAELYDGMITVEIMPEYQVSKGKEALYGWWQICIGMRYWSRDKWHEGKVLGMGPGRGVYFQPGPEGLEVAKGVAERLVRKIAEDMCRKVKEG